MPVKAARLLALLVMVAMPAVAACTGAVRLVPFLAMPLVVLGTPMIAGLCGREPAVDGLAVDTQDGDDSDDGPGGNQRPDPRPLAPCGPRGSLPLEFSAPGRWRVRGGERVRVADPGSRRSPHRRPVPDRVPGRRAVPVR